MACGGVGVAGRCRSRRGAVVLFSEMEVPNARMSMNARPLAATGFEDAVVPKMRTKAERSHEYSSTGRPALRVYRQLTGQWRSPLLLALTLHQVGQRRDTRYPRRTRPWSRHTHSTMADGVLEALLTELDRFQVTAQMDQVQAPTNIEYA